MHDLVLSASFQAVMEEPTQWTCSLRSDVEVVLDVQWDRSTLQEARISDGCFGHCDKPDHPMMALKHLLFELKEAHIECLSNKYRLQDYCSVAPAPPPIYRVLCAVCLDDCGVDIPDGVAPEGVGLCAPDHCEAGEKPPCFIYCQ